MLLTYNQWIQENGTPWPTTIPGNSSPTTADRALYTETQEMFLARFQFRKVCDNTRFSIYFNDSLKRNYSRYYELVRNEPGYSHFDWLVEEYEELQRTHEGATEKSGTTTGTSTTKKGIGSTVTTSGADTTTHTGTQKDDRDTTTTSKETTSGSTTYKGVRNVEETESGTDVLTYNGTKTTDETTSDNSTTNYNGGETENSTRTPNLTTTTDETVTDTTTGTQKSATKAAPMSASYSGATGGKLPNLNWNTMTSQAQQDNDSTDTTKTNNETTSAGNETTETTRTYSGRSDSKNGSGSRSVTEGFTGRSDDRATTGKRGTSESFNGRSDDTEGTRNGTQNTTDGNTRTYNDSIRNEKGTVVRTVYDTGEDTDNTTGTTKESGSDTTLDREIHTGRHGEIARILDYANEYIKKSSGFNWFCRQMEENFLQIFDVDDIWDEVSAWD